MEVIYYPFRQCSKSLKLLLTSVASLNWKQYSVHFLSESRDQAQIQSNKYSVLFKTHIGTKTF